MTATQFATGHPEPVPSVSQVIALPFIGAVEGYLKERAEAISEPGAPTQLRVVLHRVMNRDGEGYLQQISPYAGQGKYDPALSGRISAVTSGAIGRAYKTKKVIRTKLYADRDILLRDLKNDMVKTNDNRSINDVAISYMAVPMIGQQGEAATIMYTDAKSFNLFAQDYIVNDVLQMCQGFCNIMDELAARPPAGIRNYPLEAGTPVKAKETYYPTLQEELKLTVPSFTLLSSFNFEQSS